MYALIRASGGYSVYTPASRSVLWHDSALLADPATFYLVDAGAIGAGEPYSVRARTLLASSPDASHFHEWDKPAATRFYMPLWTETEMLAVRTLVDTRALSEQEVLDRFFEFGGVMRHVFGSEADVVKARAARKRVLDFEALVEGSLRSLWLDESDSHHPASSVWACEPDASFRSAKLRFVSVKAAAEVSTRYMRLLEAAAVLRNRYNTDTMDTMALLWEESGHHSVSEGGTFEWHSLEHDSGSGKLDLLPRRRREPWRANVRECTWADLLADPVLREAESRDYVVPRVANQPVVDAVDDRRRGYQMTVAQKGSLSRGGLRSLVKATGATPQDKFVLYFVVPRYLEGTFKRVSTLTEVKAQTGQEKLAAAEAEALLASVEQRVLIISARAHT